MIHVNKYARLLVDKSRDERMRMIVEFVHVVGLELECLFLQQ